MMGIRAWTGGRGEAQSVGPIARAIVRDLVAGHQRAHHLEGLLEPVEPIAEAAPELDPEGGVLALVPATAQPEDGPTAADVVDGRDGLGHDGRVAEGVGTDEEPQAGTCRHRGPGGQARIAFEDGTVRVAHR
jgi:catechol 2,3-dioxygenase-like lactoylglutathione lyase family enzyme